MTGPEHYREAERLIERARSDAGIANPDAAAMVLADAQVHATLALAAATAQEYADRWTGERECDVWAEAIS